MLFNSIEFLFYLPLVFFLYWFVCNKNLRLQNLLIVVASYVFYGWWDWRFLLLISFTTFCSFVSGILIDKYESKRRIQKLISASNIILNLTILGVFKYYNFFADNFAALFNSLGYEMNWVSLNIILPVGISFYTFQALSYSIDVYQKKIKATHDIIAFFAFISFFPQLVAGPIERATNLLPQFMRKRKFNYYEAVDGCRQMLWGFFKKIVIADNCAECANNIFDNYTNLPASSLLLGGVWFTFQIYCDFSGYSDIAIGCAKLFGVKLMKNFNYPYFSRDIAEFWRRWHISLTTWFRDYIYIPLGGSRVGKWKAVRNTMIIFLVSGFWHGANWTFIVWGTFHALLFLPLLLGNKNRKNLNCVAYGRILPSFKELIQMGGTFILSMFGWIIFRSENIHKAFDYIIRIFDNSIFSYPYNGISGKPYIIFLITFLIITEWIQRKKNHPLEIDKINIWIRKFIYLLIFILIILFTGNIQTFIYFQF